LGGSGTFKKKKESKSLKNSFKAKLKLKINKKN